MPNSSKKTLSALIAFLLLTLCFASAALAVPASTAPVWVTDASGERFQIKGVGDEFFSYSTDTDERLVVKDNAGFFRYVGESGGALIPLGYVGRGETDGALLSYEISSLRDKLTALRQSFVSSGGQYELNGAGPQTPFPDDYRYTNSDDPLKGRVDLFDIGQVQETARADSCGLLVLMVEFNDTPFIFGEDGWREQIFQAGVSSYFSAVSYGRFTYAPARESYGTPNDGVVKMSFPIGHPVYDLKSNGYYDIQSGLYAGSDGQVYALADSSSLFGYAVAAADSSVDYAQYDVNSDGYISPTELAIIVVVAGHDASTFGGYEAARGSKSIWPHSGRLDNGAYDCSVAADGKKLYKYTMMAENVNPNYRYNDPTASSAVQARFGTACHELGHDLGVPDLYNTNWQNGDVSQNVGMLSVMANGVDGCFGGEPIGSSPTHFDPYCKIDLGFAEAQTANGTGSYTLHAASSEDYNILRINTSDPDIYYLAENRQFQSYDRGMMPWYPHDSVGGVVLWRINRKIVHDYGFESDRNELNTMEGNYGIMPVFVSTAGYYGRAFRNAQTYDLQPFYVLPETNPPLKFTAGDSSSDAMRVSLLLADSIAAGAGTARSESKAYLTKGGAGAAVLPNGALQYTIDAPFERHTGASVDARPLQRGVDYEVKSGSTVITLKPEFLATLKDGEHTLTVYFSDGSFTQSFTTPLSSSISTLNAPEVPATGGAPFALSFLLATMLTAACAVRRKRRIDR